MKIRLSISEKLWESGWSFIKKAGTIVLLSTIVVWFAIGYQCGLAYLVSLVVYRIGGLFTGACGFSVWTIVAVAIIIGFLYMLFRPYKEEKHLFYGGKVWARS